MPLSIASLNSGSNGNCYYIGNGDEAVLIDAGISCRETELRMKRLGLPMNRVKAIFISHEHSDHIQGISTLVSKYHLPVYFSQPTLKKAGLGKIRKNAFHFTAQQPVMIGSLRITAFQKTHDACDPHSFVVSASKTNIGIFTDIGKPCDQLIHYFKQCHAAFLESNYDEDMLENGRYPLYLKNRIRSGEGHLSKENNSPELVESLFTAIPTSTRIVIASRYQETALYEISVPETDAQTLLLRTKSSTKQQLSLF